MGKITTDPEPTEDQLQKQIVKWLNSQVVTPFDFFHVPNGGSRNKIEAVKFKAMGVKRGISDLIFPIPRGLHNGMCIELKRNKYKKLTPEQQEFFNCMRDRGWYCQLIYSLDAFQDTYSWYMSQR